MANTKSHSGQTHPIRITLLGLIFLIWAIPGFAQSDNYSGESAARPRQYLLGDWGGRRTALDSRGVDFDFNHVADLQANPVGGKQQTRAGWARIRGTVDIDFGRLAEINGLTFHATGLWQYGANLGEKIGTLANPSALVSAHSTRLDSWWFQQALFPYRLFIKAGQFAGQDFYGVQQYGRSYLIEPLGYALGNLFSNTYESFRSAGTPAAEIRFFPLSSFYIKSAVLAGNRDPFNRDPTGFGFAIRNTPVFVYEAGYLVDESETEAPNSASPRKIYPGSYKLGGAYNGGKFHNPITNQDNNGNYLIYFMANQAVYRPFAGSNRGLDLDFALDWSPTDLNQEYEQITGGLRYNGIIPHRDQDGLAFGVVYSKISDQFSSGGTLLGLPSLGSEKAIELNYSIQVSRCILLQPAFQYYIDVGANSHVPNAAVLGFRTKVTF